MAMLPIEEPRGISLIEGIVEDPPHVIVTKNMEDLENSHDYYSEDDHICTLDLPQEETTIEPYEETYDKVCMVYDDISPYGDKGLESFTRDIVETKPMEEDYDHEVDRCSLGHDAVSLISDNDGDDTYWTFIDSPIHETFGNFVESPIYDMSREGSVDLEILGNPGMEEEHSEFSYDHSEPYHSKTHTSISNEDPVKQCNDE